METNSQIQLFKDKKGNDQTGPLFWANLLAKEDVVINQGGTWSGKTHSIMQVLFTIAILNPGYVITVISNTVTKLKEDAIRISKGILSDTPILRNYLLPGALGYNQTDRVYNFRNGSLIEFKSFEDEEQAKGGKRHILFVNEASRIKYMVFFEAQLRTEVRTFVDYNPTSSFWCHTKVISNPLEYKSVKVLRSWHIHNPFVPDKQRERIEGIQDKELWKVYARGLTGILKGTVYPGWVEVENFPASMDGVVWGADWGYTNDPTAVVRVAVAPAGTGLDFIVDEITYSPGIPMSTVVRMMMDNGYKAGQIMYCDHDKTLINECRMLGVSATMAIKGPNSILSGILFLRSRKVGYTKRSEHLKHELKQYKFIEIDGNLTNQPSEDWNHLCVARNTLISTPSGEVPISDIKIGDIVLTSDGPNKVLNVLHNGLNLTKRFWMQYGDNSLSLECTPDHLIKTNLGWIQISKLQSGMTVYLDKLSTGTSIDCIREKSIFPEAGTECTEKYGYTLTGLFQKVTTFITSMKTNGITSRRIWNLKYLLSIGQNTPKRCLGITRNLLKTSMKKGLKLLSLGIHPPMVSNGTERMQCSATLVKGTMAPMCAQIAGLSLLKTPLFNNFAQLTASTNTTGKREKIKGKCRSAQSAVRSSWLNQNDQPQHALKIVLTSVWSEPGLYQEVMDLTVENDHTYFANGILVHNCDSVRMCAHSYSLATGQI